MSGSASSESALPESALPGLRGSGKPFSIAYFDERRDGIHGRGEGRVGGVRGGKGAGNEGVGDEGLIEEMISGIDEMRDVQEVIKMTFNALHDVIKAQGHAIKSLEREMKTKVSGVEMEAALKHKANILDINSSLQDVAMALDNKANSWDLDSKIERSEMLNILSERARANDQEEAAQLASSYGKQEDFELIRLQIEHQASSFKMQGEFLKADLEKASKEFVSNIADVREELRIGLERKLDLTPFEDKFRLGFGVAQGAVAQILAGKCDMDRAEHLCSSLADQIQQLRDEVQIHVVESKNVRCSEGGSLEEVTRKQKVAIDTLEQTVASLKTEVAAGKVDGDNMTFIHSEYELRIRGRLSEMHAEFSAANKATRDHISASEESVAQKLKKQHQDWKFDLESLSEVLGGKIDSEVGAVKRQVERLVAESIEALEIVLNHKVSKEEMQKGLKSKADKADVSRENEMLKSLFSSKNDQVHKELLSKADAKRITNQTDAAFSALARQEEALKDLSTSFSESLSEVIGGMRRLERDVAGKASKLETESKLELILRDLSAKTAELAGKAAMKDVIGLLDAKADADEVNRALLEVNRQITLKASLEEISKTLQEQTLLNSALITELCLGRWIWKSLKTKVGGAVPWNIQTANSDPGNLIWEKDKSSITCVSPGLYELCFGFYSRKRPMVRVCVNGEPILSISAAPTGISTSSGTLQWPVQYHAGARHSSSGRFTSSNITGLTHVDFIALPAKAKVSFIYQGDDDAEGFVTLRKM